MIQNIIQVNYPVNYLDTMQLNASQFEREAKLAMAVKLFELKKLSSGMAASLVDMDRVSFLMMLHQYNVPMIDLDEDELSSDLKNA